MITVKALWQYPFKSGKGISLPFAQFDNEGMIGDRRLVALDEKGIFVTARRYAELLHLSCTPNEQGWLLQHPNASTNYQLTRSLIVAQNTQINGTLWRDELNGIDAGDEASAWLSEVIKVKVRVVLWQEKTRTSGKYNLETNFSDAAPLLIATQESLIAASSLANISPDMRRFRPNIVLTGAEAFAEERWQELNIGNQRFTLLDTCVRCILTTRDPDTGIAHDDKQPLRALKAHHTNEQRQPIFGINAKLMQPIASGEQGKIFVGDEVTVR